MGSVRTSRTSPRLEKQRTDSSVIIADAVIEDMRSVGEYHMVDNNCQIFYRKLSNVIVMNRNYSNDNINDAKTIKLLAIQALKDFKHSIFGDD